MHNYCTIISKDSLYRGLLLYYSLKKHDPNFRLFMIFMKEDVKGIVERMGLSDVVAISLKTIEEHDPELSAVRNTRDVKEYAWTVKAPGLLHILENHRDVESIVYLDADIEFYSSPEPIFQELSKCSILLTRERFYIQDNKEWYRQYGRFNGGFMAFNRNWTSLEALRWLRGKCIAWCYNKVEKGFYGDQIFIDQMSDSFEGVGISKNLGINATAWYAHASVMEAEDGKIVINAVPLVFYHYSGFIYYNGEEYDLCVYINLPEELINMIYLPYMKRINAVARFVSQFDSGFARSVIAKNEGGYYKNYYKIETENTFLRDSSSLSTQSASNFCTIVGSEYIVRGLTLYQSLKEHSPDFHLFICCLDDGVKAVLEAMHLENATLIPLARIENMELLRVKTGRTMSEYCWTIKSFLMLYILKVYQEIDSLVYLDADLFFFSNTEPVFEELRENSVLIVTQKDSEESDRVFGTYQAGFIGVVRDENAFRCLNWWKDRCLEWCSSEQGHPDKWGDQKYLNRWPELFEGVKVTENWGIDAAIWNIFMNYSLENGEVFVKGDRLISYHFCCFQIFNEEDYNLWMWPNWIVTSEIARAVYLPYIKLLRKSMEKIREAGFNVVELWDNSSDMDKAVNYYRYVHEE